MQYLYLRLLDLGLQTSTSNQFMYKIHITNIQIALRRQILVSPIISHIFQSLLQKSSKVFILDYNDAKYLDKLVVNHN